MVEGRAFSHTLSFRTTSIIRYIASCSTGLCAFIMGKAMKSAQIKAFPFLKGHPALEPTRPAAHAFSQIPFFSDYLASYLRDGDIESVPGIEEVTGPQSVRLTGGRQIDDVDAIILCSGYRYDYSMLQGKGHPTDPAFAPDGYKRLDAAPYNTDNERLPRLYRGVFSESYPESLAIVGHFLMMGSPFMVNDLVTMALASVWSGSFPVPTKEEMKKDIDAHYNFVVSTVEKRKLINWGFRLDCRDAFDWYNRAAGTGVMERVGAWGWQGWKFWLADRKFYKLLMDGVSVPAMYRLFDTGRGRKAWSGAREYIEKVNEDVKQMGERWQKEQSLKPKQV